MRQHVNPLSGFFQLHHRLPSADELFPNNDLPIHLDIGCARGKFLIEMASCNPQWNFVGVDIRETLVKSAEKERFELGIDNLRFLFCNANRSLASWLPTLKNNQLKRISIQFIKKYFILRISGTLS